MRRGDIVSVQFAPPGANDRQLAVVVSNDGANRTAHRLGKGTVTVVPVTASTGRAYPFQVLLPAGSSGLAQASTAHAEQIRSVDVDRIDGVLGHLPPALLEQLDDAIRVHLGLNPDVAP